MSDAATLLAEFIDQLNSGGAPDAGEFLARADDDAQRLELADAIDAALMFAPEDLRHPRAEDGSFVLGLGAERLAKVTQVTWPEVMPIWLREAELTEAELAGAVLETGGIETSAENVAEATSWIDAIKSGAETITSISAKAREALADALQVAREAFDAAGDFSPEAEIAFRGGDNEDAFATTHALMDLSVKLDAALPQSEPQSEVDRYFSA